METSQSTHRMSVSDAGLERLLNEFEVARITGLSVATIRRRRLLGHPPNFVKLGSSVRYKPSAVRDWIDSQEAR